MLRRLIGLFRGVRSSERHSQALLPSPMMLSTAEVVNELQALAQRATRNELPLEDLAEQLSALANKARAACNGGLGASAAGNPAADGGVSGAAAAAAAAPGGLVGSGVGQAGGGHVGGTRRSADSLDRGEAGKAAEDAHPSKKQRKAPREFDFSRYRTRYVALELMYVGWAFQGFARQDTTENTIEGAMFAALRKVRLIPEAAAVPISELSYSRCGRTDRGVSALGQVVALKLRSSARIDEPEATLEKEYDYPRLINKALPPEIRVLGWTPVPEDFNARFSAKYREYKYFIVQQGEAVRFQQQQRQQGSQQQGQPEQQQQQQQDGASAGASGQGQAPARTSDAVGTPIGEDGAGGDDGGGGSGGRGGCGGGSGGGADGGGGGGLLDINAMRRAAALFVGEHDFRNFCKPDVGAVRSFRRTILSFTIDPVDTASAGGYGMRGSSSSNSSSAASHHRVYALTVRGTAFLWHQVRCMAAVLLMVGRRQEAPEVVARMLDVQATPCKPQYSMAPEEPLLLYACGYEGLTFIRTHAATDGAQADVTGLLHRHLVGAALTGACQARIASDPRNDPGAAAAGGGGGSGGGGGRGDTHIPLFKRQTEPSIEERMARRGIPWPPEPSGGGADAAMEADEGD